MCRSPARKNTASRAGRNRMDLREGMEMVGMGMLLCLLGPTPASLKSFGIRSAGSKTEELLHSLHPNRDLESLARDLDEIGYPRLNAVVNKRLRSKPSCWVNDVKARGGATV